MYAVSSRPTSKSKSPPSAKRPATAPEYSKGPSGERDTPTIQHDWLPPGHCGANHELTCDHSDLPPKHGRSVGFSGKGIKATGCKWKVHCEESIDGWIVRFGVWGGWEGCAAHGHNHVLNQTKAEVMSTAMGREIPAELQEFGKRMAKHGIPANAIKNALDGEANAAGKEITWEISDVRRICSASVENRILDMTETHDYLKERVRGVPMLERVHRTIPVC